MGIPVDILVSKMYQKEAKKQAKVQVKLGLAESEDEMEAQDQTSGDNAQKSSPSIGITASKASIPQKAASVKGK